MLGDPAAELMLIDTKPQDQIVCVSSVKLKTPQTAQANFRDDERPTHCNCVTCCNGVGDGGRGFWAGVRGWGVGCEVWCVVFDVWCVWCVVCAVCVRLVWSA